MIKRAGRYFDHALIAAFPNDKLKLIIMSATLNVQDFLPDPSRHVQLFPQLTKNDIINVQTRQFNVQIKFNR